MPKFGEYADQADLDAHLNDTSAAHAASAISVADSGGYFTGTDVEAALQELGAGGGGGGLFDAYAHIRDEKTANTSGGTPTTGSFQTRTLNTEVSDPSGIVSLSSNQFTLGAGTYWIKARSPFYAAGRCKIKLRNITDSSDALIGSSAYCNNSAYSHIDAIVEGRITIAGTKAFEIQYRCENTDGTTRGLGVESNFGVVEVYTEVEIWREA